MHVQTRSAAGVQIQFWQGQQNLFCFFSWSRAGIWLEGTKRVMTTGGYAIFIMIAAGCFEGLGFRVWQSSHWSSFFGFQVLGESVDVELLLCNCNVGFAASEDNIWSAHCDRCPWSLSGFFHIQPALSQKFWFWALWLTSSNKAQKRSWRVTKLVTLNLGLCIIVWAGGKGGRHYTNSSILMPTGKCTPSLIWVLGFMVKPVEFWAGCCSTVAMSPGFLLGPKLIEHILQMWQTDLLVAAAKTGRVINIKKGQFCASSVSLYS